MADLPGYIVDPDEQLTAGVNDPPHATVTEAAPRSQVLRTPRRYPVIPTNRLIMRPA
jgi:hypothetical protein